MAKHLDLNIWVTQQAFADILSKKEGKTVPVQRVHNWVQRDKIDWQRLPGSRIKLVNRFTATPRPYNSKK